MISRTRSIIVAVCAVFCFTAMRCGGYLSTPSTSVDEDTATTEKFVDVITQGGSTCALSDTGSVYCWGGNRLGFYPSESASAQHPEPVKISTLPATSSLFAMSDDICGYTADGTSFWCVGRNDDVVLGNGGITFDTYTAAAPYVKTFTEFLGYSPATFSEHGGGTQCAISPPPISSARCWGNNDNGQVGDNTTSNRSSPVATSPSAPLVQISAANRNHTCAVTTTGGVQCWGLGTSGQLGSGVATSLTPITVTGMMTASKVVLTEATSCALLTSGSVQCWGNNNNGGVGDNGNCATPCSTPQTVLGITDAIAITAGNNAYLAILTDGTLKCWGGNLDGQFGNGESSNLATRTPVACGTGLSDLKKISMGDVGGVSTACAVTNAGEVYCWGRNAYSQVGVSSTDSPEVFTAHGPITVP